MKRLVIFEGSAYLKNTYKNGNIVLTPANDEEALLAKQEEWADRVLYAYDGEYKFVRQGRKVYAFFIEQAGDSFGSGWGVARCSRKDKFNEKIGRAIAISRAEEDNIPSMFYTQK